MCLIKSLELLRRQQLSIVQQIGASAFFTLVHWQKLSEVDNKWILHISIVFAIRVPKIITFAGDLTKFWQKQQMGHFWHTHPACRHNLQFNRLDCNLNGNYNAVPVCLIFLRSTELFTFIYLD